MAPTNIFVPGVPSISKTRRRILGVGSTPAPPNTLVAGTGVFILNGDAMLPGVGYVASVSAGSFTLTGQSATLRPPPGHLLLTDGTSFLLLVDGTSQLLMAV